MIGILSDTHGLLRPEAIQALSESDLILHAGDVGSEDVLKHLQQIAPVIAVRGNIDSGSWAEALPKTAALELGKHAIWMLHNLDELDLDPAHGGFGVVVAGHSHQPRKQIKDGILYLNPGSAGRRRFRLPITLVRADFDVSPPVTTFLDLLNGQEFTPSY